MSLFFCGFDDEQIQKERGIVRLPLKEFHALSVLEMSLVFSETVRVTSCFLFQYACRKSGAILLGVLGDEFLPNVQECLNMVQSALVSLSQPIW